MKKKFMRGLAAALAVIMMVPTAAFANQTGEDPNAGIMTVSTTPSIDKATIYTSNGASATAIPTIKNTTGLTNFTIRSWSISPADSAYIDLNPSNGAVTAKAPGTATVTLDYTYDVITGTGSAPTQTPGSISWTVEVKKYELVDVQITNYPITLEAGATFDKDQITVKATYSDSDASITLDSDDFSITSPSGAVVEGNNQDLTVSVPNPGGTAMTDTVKYHVHARQSVVTGFTVEIRYPDGQNNTFVNGDVIRAEDIILHIQKDGAPSGDEILASSSGVTLSGKMASGSYTVTNEDVKTGTGEIKFDVTYATKKVENVTVALKKAEAETPTQKSLTIADATTTNVKKTYKVGDSVDLSNLSLSIRYSDKQNTETKKYSLHSSNITYSPTAFATTGTHKIQVWYTEDPYGRSTNYLEIPVTVNANTTVSVSKLYDSTTSTSYAYSRKTRNPQIGEYLDWEDYFNYIYIKKTDGTYVRIDDDNDLHDTLGSNATLHLVVDGRETDSDANKIKSSDVYNNKVDLKLYLEYPTGTTTFRGDDYAIMLRDTKVGDLNVTAKIYYSATSSTSYGKEYSTDSLKDMLYAIEDESDFNTSGLFDTTLGSSRVIKIQLKADAEFEPDTNSERFAPDYDNTIIIDLNGYDLELDSEWIDYDKCEDLKVIITNTDADEDGKLTLTDISSSSITVEKDDELEFTKGNIPSDAEKGCTVTVRKTSSSTPVVTKTFDDIEEALDAMEDKSEFKKKFGKTLESNYRFTIKLGETEDGHSLSKSYRFEPDYDNAITIDLNGYDLSLSYEWIEYNDDNEDLKVTVTNTSSDNADLEYVDFSKDTKIKIEKSKSIEFTKDATPGIYTVTLKDATNGKVAADRETVTHGGTVTFTITPDSGYEISTVKVGSKSITTSTDGYSVSSKGVGTYKMEDVEGNLTMTVTFKKASASANTNTNTNTSTSTTNWTNPFTDISSKDQYYDAVAFVCSNGLFNGMSATKFEPRTTMTRAMYVTVLGRLAGVDVSKYTKSSYTDVSVWDSSISYAVPYIEWATEMGIIQGYGNGKFGPKDNITHQQMYLMMYRYAMYVENIPVSGLTTVSLSNIRDASEIADWAETGVKFASKYGILITSGGKLTPADNALRCELAMLLHGFCTKVLGLYSSDYLSDGVGK